MKYLEILGLTMLICSAVTLILGPIVLAVIGLFTGAAFVDIVGMLGISAFFSCFFWILYRLLF